MAFSITFVSSFVVTPPCGSPTEANEYNKFATRPSRLLIRWIPLSLRPQLAGLQPCIPLAHAQKR